MNFVLVSGDFVPTGGMDRANLALASYLARSNSSRTVHIVAHRADASITSLANVKFHRVPKPMDSYFLGAPLLDRAGRRIAARVPDARVIVNGANCDWPDVNWVHYVHTAWNPGNFDSLPIVNRVNSRWRRNRSLADEAANLPRAQLLIANSNRTKQDLIVRLGVSPDRIRVIYYGVDPAIFYPAGEDEKRSMRETLRLPTDHPLVAFVGSPGDRRKGFDVLHAAWMKSPIDAELIVIGAGEVKREGTIDHLGFRSDVPAILRCCDALIAPTRYEAYGLAIHEAVCCGLPVIVSANAGVAERFPESLSPLMLREISIEEISLRLQIWRDDRPHWRTLVEPVSSQFRARTWNQMSAEIVESLDKP